jgi:hypothetical protein
MVVEAIAVRLYGGLLYGSLLAALIWLAKEKLCLLSILRRLIIFFTTFEGSELMSKRELIDYICEINRSAKPEFLANFSEEDLNAYLEHLMELDLEELVVCS